MKKGIVIAITGIITGIFGTTFHLQGQSAIGPESSFMYSNPDWISYGLQIAAVGMILLFAGIIIVKKNSSS